MTICMGIKPSLIHISLAWASAILEGLCLSIAPMIGFHHAPFNKGLQVPVVLGIVFLL